jgi:hypothetical protein
VHLPSFHGQTPSPAKRKQRVAEPEDKDESEEDPLLAKISDNVSHLLMPLRAITHCALDSLHSKSAEEVSEPEELGPVLSAKDRARKKMVSL